MKQPSILLIHLHDAGRAFSPLGWPVPTPRTHEFFDSGAAAFRNAFTVAPTCTPSRVALMTGLHPHEVGVYGLAHLGHPLRGVEKHLAHRLGEAGYTTCLSGVQHEYAHGQDVPYQIVEPLVPAPGPGDLVAFDRAASAGAVRFLGEYDNETKPFFLSMGFVLPHRDFPETDLSLADRGFSAPLGWPQTPECQADYLGLCTAMAHVDARIGEVLDALSKNVWSGNTLVLLTTDHGPAFPGMKCNLNDGGLGVGLFIRPPGGRASCPYVDALVTHIDVHATLCDYGGITVPAASEGRSLRSWIERGEGVSRDHFFASIHYHVEHQPTRAVRDTRYLYVRNFDGGKRQPGGNIDNSLSKTWWETHDVGRDLPAAGLYDLWADPLAVDNRIADPDLAQRAEQMEAMLESWMVASNDPLRTVSGDLSSLQETV